MFLTFFSTAAMQALYAGKPVINLDFGGDEGVKRYAASGATAVAQSEAGLADHLRAVLSGVDRSRADARERFLDATVFKTDGAAARRVVELADRCLSQRLVNT